MSVHRPFPSAAPRMADIAPFHVMELMKKAQALEAAGRDIVHMEVGEPDFPTPEPILKAAMDHLEGGHVHYTSALGLPALREAIAGFYFSRYGVHLRPERVIVTAGASAALLLALGVLVAPGDEILLTDPGYPCNRNFVRLFEGVPRALPVGPETDFQPTPQQVGTAWNDRTKGLMLASPANPTGTLVKPETLQALTALVEGHGGVLIVDEIYHGLTYGMEAGTALALSERTLVVNSFSKYFNMTGWRLGWLVVPEVLVRDMEKLAQNLYISPPTPAQFGALAAFRPESLAILEARRLEFQARRDFLLAELPKMGFRLPVQPHGAFYIYADSSGLADDSYELAGRLIEEAGVAVTPGLDFGRNAPEKHLRFAYTTSLERLREGVVRLSRFLG
jgi:aspartate/methionine/tyrosine aminotransferase